MHMKINVFTIARSDVFAYIDRFDNDAKRGSTRAFENTAL